MGTDPKARLHPWCFEWDERKQCGAVYDGPPEQRYLAKVGGFLVQNTVLAATRDFEALSLLAASKNERIRSGVPKRIAQLGIVDGGSGEDIIGLLADDESTVVRSAVAGFTSDPELKRYMASDPEHEVRRSVLTGTEDQDLISSLAGDAHPYVRATVAHVSNDRVLLASLLTDQDDWVRSRATDRLRALR